MKKVYLVLAFMVIGANLFATEIIKNENVEVALQTEITIDSETKIDDEGLICMRTCFYQNGQPIGCTEWVCTETLDEVVVTANKQ